MRMGVTQRGRRVVRRKERQGCRQRKGRRRRAVRHPGLRWGVSGQQQLGQAAAAAAAVLRSVAGGNK
jgi:hypothetical protein